MAHTLTIDMLHFWIVIVSLVDASNVHIYHIGTGASKVSV